MYCLVHVMYTIIVTSKFILQIYCGSRQGGTFNQLANISHSAFSSLLLFSNSSSMPSLRLVEGMFSGITGFHLRLVTRDRTNDFGALLGHEG